MSIYTNINDFSKKAGFLVDQVAIGMRIKEIRQYYNLTVEEFADILNISVNAVYKWQRGDSAPDITNIGIICGKFDVRIEYLMFGTGDCFRAVSCSILWKLFESKKHGKNPMFIFIGVGGIRTLVPEWANAFRVRPVMTTSIQLHIV